VIFYDMGSSSTEVALVKYSTYRSAFGDSSRQLVGCCCPLKTARSTHSTGNWATGGGTAVHAAGPDAPPPGLAPPCRAPRSAKEPGSSKPKVTNQFEVLDADWDASLGANALDMLLADKFAAEFAEKTGLGDVRCVARARSGFAVATRRVFGGAAVLSCSGRITGRRVCAQHVLSRAARSKQGSAARGASAAVRGH
jgi:hypothetical protein